jgi:DNA-binding NarL/FixJ family response regulator
LIALKAMNGMNYLIVDDHPRTRKAVIEALRQPGDVFVEVGTGEEAVEAYDHLQPDWTIMDVRMPGRGGLAATSEILFRHPHARILILSQHDEADVADQSRASGATGFISKDQIADLSSILQALSDFGKEHTD